MATRGGVGTTIATRGGVGTTIVTRGGRRPRFEPAIATRGGRRPQGWHHGSDARRSPATGFVPITTRGSRTVLRATSARLRAVLELRHEACGLGRPTQSGLLNPRFEPRLRHEEAAPSRYNHGVEPAMATRGRRRPQLANSAQGASRPRITTPSQNRKKGRGWHTNREGRRAYVGKSPRNLMPGSEPV